MSKKKDNQKDMEDIILQATRESNQKQRELVAKANQKEWEERFNKEFKEKIMGLIVYPEQLILDELKSFIQQELDKQMEWVLKTLEEAEIHCAGSCGAGCEYAVEDLKQKIQERLNQK